MFSGASRERSELPDRSGEYFPLSTSAQFASWGAFLGVFARFCAFPDQKYAENAVFGPFFMVSETFLVYVY